MFEVELAMFTGMFISSLLPGPDSQALLISGIRLVVKFLYISILHVGLVTWGRPGKTCFIVVTCRMQ